MCLFLWVVFCIAILLDKTNEQNAQTFLFGPYIASLKETTVIMFSWHKYTIKIVLPGEKLLADFKQYI